MRVYSVSRREEQQILEAIPPQLRKIRCTPMCVASSKPGTTFLSNASAATDEHLS